MRQGFNWQRLLDEKMLVDPRDLNGNLIEHLFDDFWQIEEHVFARTYANSTTDNPLVQQYFWAPDVSALLWMVKGQRLSAEKIESLQAVDVPNIWPFIFTSIEHLEAIGKQLTGDQFKNLFSGHRVNRINETTLTLAFNRLRLFFLDIPQSQPQLIGFQVLVQGAMVGG